MYGIVGYLFAFRAYITDEVKVGSTLVVIRIKLLFYGHCDASFNGLITQITSDGD